MSKRCKAEDDLLFLKQELKNAEVELNLNVLDYPNKNIVNYHTPKGVWLSLNYSLPD